MITVNSNGQEYTVETIEEAEEICKAEMAKGNGSDIWVDDSLYKTYMYNPFTGKFEVS